MPSLSAELQIDTVRIDGTELLDAMVTSVFLLDPQLHVTYLNAAAQTLLGLSTNQALGRSIAELTRGAESLLPMFDRVRDAGEGVVQRELAWSAPGGVDRILDCAVTQVVMGGQSLRLLLEIEDITQHRRLTRENALLARLDGSRLMIKQLAHEIKNPLGGLRGAAQLLERELHEDSLREYTRVIIGEADRLTALVDSMAGPNRLPLKAMLNVHELCEHVYHLLHAEARGVVTVDRDYDPSLPNAALDRNQMIQALLNVARNALQAVGQQPADYTGRIVLRTRAMSNVSIGPARHRLVASVQIEDNGPGVPDDLRSSIFYPLVTGRANGTGLGLAVAQELVTRNGGLIEFESEPGRTIFTLLLPLGEAT